VRWLVILVLLFGCGHKFDPLEARDIRATAAGVGSPAPDAQVVLPSGSKVQLATLLRPKTVVVFYRGFY
jgi:hypothetical protein